MYICCVLTDNAALTLVNLPVQRPLFQKTKISPVNSVQWNPDITKPFITNFPLQWNATPCQSYSKTESRYNELPLQRTHLPGPLALGYIGVLLWSEPLVSDRNHFWGLMVLNFLSDHLDITVMRRRATRSEMTTNFVVTPELVGCSLYTTQLRYVKTNMSLSTWSW